MYLFSVHEFLVKFNKIKSLKLKFMFNNNKLIIVRACNTNTKLDPSV